MQTPVAIALVAIQIATLAVLPFPWGAQAFRLPGYALIAAGLLLGAITLKANPPGNFSIFPEPRRTARLITHGPYRFVRHPMYLAVLACAAGLLVGWRTPVHAFALALLAVVLHLKAGIEERALAARFPQYAAYRARTARLIPFLL
jgi:protein-S-isoprenylcysteine O-methyltransferase Ste14